MKRWAAPALIGAGGVCVVAALIVGGDTALYLIAATALAAFAGIIVAYLIQ